MLVNASGEFKKGTPKNYLTEDGILKIAAAYTAGLPIPGFAARITLEQAADADFNLSPSRHIARPDDPGQTRDLASALAAYETARAAAAEASDSVAALIRQLADLAAD